MRAHEPAVSVTVLLVVSSDDVRRAFSQALCPSQFQLMIVPDAHNAFDTAVTRKPDVIVATFDPDHRDDRLDLCRRICADSHTRDIPILLTSETIDVEDVRLATKAGALALAAHPLDGAKLVGAIRGVLAARERRRRPRFDPAVHSDTLNRRSA